MLNTNSMFNYMFGTQENIRFTTHLIELHYNLKEGTLDDSVVINNKEDILLLKNHFSNILTFKNFTAILSKDNKIYFMGTLINNSIVFGRETSK